MKTAVLKDNRDFQRLYHRGKKCVSGMFAVYYRRNGGTADRIGITAGTKLGCAVVRNRIRRQIREIVRLSAEDISPGYDIVIVARSRAIGKAWQDQRADLLSLLDSGGLLCRTNGGTQ
ncbi:MAG: ribonuclease P protein component [Clostridiales bacterium]|nr:ribonuclease P protein component [Clostridiales bacterium]